MIAALRGKNTFKEIICIFTVKKKKKSTDYLKKKAKTTFKSYLGKTFLTIFSQVPMILLLSGFLGFFLFVFLQQHLRHVKVPGTVGTTNWNCS